MKILEFGAGKIKITPCLASAEDTRNALLLEDTKEEHVIGISSDPIEEPYVPGWDSILLIFGCIESVEVLVLQLQEIIGLMRENIR